MTFTTGKLIAFINLGEWPNSLKSICLKLLLIIVTGTDNVSQNTLLEYLMMDSILETMMKVLIYQNSLDILKNLPSTGK